MLLKSYLNTPAVYQTTVHEVKNLKYVINIIVIIGNDIINIYKFWSA